MAFKYSTGFKKAVCDNTSVKDTFDGGFIKVYSAPTTIPADADAALPGDAVLLLSFSDNSGAGGLTLADEAVGGSISKNSTQVWSGAAAASGVPAFFRYVQDGDTGNSSTSAVRIQGLVGTAGADMNLSSATITNGTTYTLDFFSLTFLGG